MNFREPPRLPPPSPAELALEQMREKFVRRQTGKLLKATAHLSESLIVANCHHCGQELCREDTQRLPRGFERTAAKIAGRCLCQACHDQPVLDTRRVGPRWQRRDPCAERGATCMSPWQAIAYRELEDLDCSEELE